jgi:hypothetical protein
MLKENVLPRKILLFCIRVVQYGAPFREGLTDLFMKTFPAG